MDLADFGPNFQFTIPAPKPAMSATSGVVNSAEIALFARNTNPNT
jgi:hypothetical protein